MTPTCLTAIPSAIVGPLSPAWTPTMRTSGRTDRSARRDSRREAAAADRDHDRPRLRHLLGELEPDRRLAGDHALVLVRMDEGAVGLLRALERGRERILEGRAHELDVRAVVLGRLDLRHRRVLRHEDGRLDARLASCPGHRLPVVARAGRDHAGRFSDSESVAILLTAPRILNEPVRCRFSAFSATSRPMSFESVSVP